MSDRTMRASDARNRPPAEQARYLAAMARQAARAGLTALAVACQLEADAAAKAAEAKAPDTGLRAAPRWR